MLNIRFSLLALLLFLIPSSGLAAVPTTMNYQGELSDSSGQPINGVVSITFSIHDVLTGGLPLWLENQSVTVDKGGFSANLGTVNPLPVTVFEAPRYLQMFVNGELLTPRVQLRSSSFAFKAADADTLGGVSSSQLDQSAHVGATNNPHSVTAAQVGSADTSTSNTFSVGQTIQTGSGLSSGLVIQGAPVQTANLQEWRDSAGTPLVTVGPAGNVSATSFTGDGSGLTNVPGSVPTGAMIVLDSVISPPGYTYSGMQMVASHGDSDTWNDRNTSMPTVRGRFALAAAINGKIYVIGGTDGASLGVNEEYDPVADSWTTKAPMPTPRYDLAAVAINGKIYALGGTDGFFFGGVQTYFDLNEEYDPVSDSWITKAPMLTRRSELAAVGMNGKIYAIGGMGNVFNGMIFVPTDLDVNEEYDPIADSWTTKAPMPTPRYDLAAAAINGKIYALGGRNGPPLGTNEEYDPVADSWTAMAPMPTPRYALAAVAIFGKIYVVGGFDTGAASVANEAYDLLYDQWTAKKTMPQASAPVVAVGVNGKIYAISNGFVLKYSPESPVFLHIKN